MRLFIAEKFEVAQAIIQVLGGKLPKGKPYACSRTDDVVTYCSGHILELKDPGEIDPKYKKWSIDQLPIPAFLPAQRKVIKVQEERIKIIQNLLSKATVIVHAGDPDEEGQLVVDEILRYFNNTKPVMRVLINDITPAAVKKSLDELLPNENFEHLGYKAESRSIADQLFGFNLTRLYKFDKRNRTRRTLHIGRVKTPIMALVVDRDTKRANHKKKTFYKIEGEFLVGGIRFTAQYQPREIDPKDEEGRLIDKNHAYHLARILYHHLVKVISVKTESYEEPAPLPYDLLSLQIDAIKIYNISAKETLKITQRLRTKYSLISYNRTDSRYLPDDAFLNVEGVISSIYSNFEESSEVKKLCLTVNKNQKGRVFDSSKAQVHHAIIPTQSTIDWDNLEKEEKINKENYERNKKYEYIENYAEKAKNIYRLIVDSYIAQFLPPYEYDKTKIVLNIVVDGIPYQFSVTSRQEKSTGHDWRISRHDKITGSPDEITTHLQSIKKGITGELIRITVNKFVTQPEPAYTEDILLRDFAEISKYVNKNLAEALEKQDGPSEYRGIGTPAT